MRLLFVHAYSTFEPASSHLRLAASDVHRFLASWLPSKRMCNLCQQKPCSQALTQLSRCLQYWDVTDVVFDSIKHCLGANWRAGQTVPVAPLQRHNLAGAWANMRLRINYTYFAEQKNCRYISSQTIRTCIFVIHCVLWALLIWWQDNSINHILLLYESQLLLTLLFCNMRHYTHTLILALHSN